MDKGISHVLSMSILLYGLRRPIFNSQDKEPYSFVELKAQEKTGLLLMPTAKVTKNVSAAEGGGNVLCSILISIKTKAWLYSFLRGTYKQLEMRYEFSAYKTVFSIPCLCCRICLFQQLLQRVYFSTIFKRSDRMRGCRTLTVYYLLKPWIQSYIAAVLYKVFDFQNSKRRVLCHVAKN